MTKGQQVEVVSTECQGAPDYCLVRLVGAGLGTGSSSSSGAAAASKEASSPSDLSSAQEGLVPTSILKPFPAQRKEEAASNGKLQFCLILVLKENYKIYFCLIINRPQCGW